MFSPSFCFSQKMSKECVAEENEKNIIKVLMWESRFRCPSSIYAQSKRLQIFRHG